MLAALMEGKIVCGHEAETLTQRVCVHLASQVFFTQKPELPSSEK